MSIFGFFGDFFLPKHFFRFVGRVGKETLPGGEAEGQKPNPKQVLTLFMERSSQASQTIGDRVFPGKVWASRRVPGIGMNLGGLAILGAWSCLVLGLLAFGYSRLLAGLQRPLPAIRAGVRSSPLPTRTTTNPEER